MTEGQFVVGHFDAAFRDENAAKAAARDARAVGYVVDVEETGAGGWAIIAWRKDPFPADEQQRYAARMRAIAIRHGGSYMRFVPEAPQ